MKGRVRQSHIEVGMVWYGLLARGLSGMGTAIVLERSTLDSECLFCAAAAHILVLYVYAMRSRSSGVLVLYANPAVVSQDLEFHLARLGTNWYGLICKTPLVDWLLLEDGVRVFRCLTISQRAHVGVDRVAEEI